MARITITDLRQDFELDRQALRAIAGGARWRAVPASTPATPTRVRLVGYPSGFVCRDEGLALSPAVAPIT